MPTQYIRPILIYRPVSYSLSIYKWNMDYTVKYYKLTPEVTELQIMVNILL